MKQPLFDRTLLPPARCEFVVIADTHYMLDPGDRPVEFASRRLQTARADAALHLAAALEPDFAIHLGDLVQEYPDTPVFDRALDQALEQLRASSLPVRHVAGNHDVGDKPDPTMPAHPVTPRTLDLYHRRYGPSWYSFDRGDLHFAVLNAQLMNTGLPQEAEQRQWFEDDLAAHPSGRTFLFLHMPPYLWAADEPHLGHYDNLGEPARAWLLQLLDRHRVELLFAGHVHFAFYDRRRHTRLAIAPSASFTRPGFGHLFTAGPPPEQGRDDAPKLGFYLCRVLDDRTDLHLIRTRGDSAPDPSTRLVTPAPAGLRDAPLGITLLHPLAPATEVPLAWPSAVRQPVRNDYPLLACLELGATAARLPWTDFAAPLQRSRLSLLRAEGVQIQAFGPAPDDLDLHARLDAHPACADAWELQLPGSPWPTDACLHQLRDCRRRASLCLSTLLPGQRVPGKQHPRTRTGFLAPELPELDRRLRQADVCIDAVLCRLDYGLNPWEAAREFAALPELDRIGRVDYLLTLPGLDDQDSALLATEARFAAAQTPGSRLYVDPLIDLDRTMDVRHGLLDPLCNPRPAFHALRCLNALLHFHRDHTFTPASAVAEGIRLLRLDAPTVSLVLLLTRETSSIPDGLFVPGCQLHHLCRGTVESPSSPADLRVDGPALLVVPR